MIAAIQAPIIMMSQNRQAARDRIDAEVDHEVNVRAELAIHQLEERLHAIEGRLAEVSLQRGTSLIPLPQDERKPRRWA